jgi:hypothetical protein
MSEPPPSNNGRTMGGRFAPGHKFARGNPGARHRATLMAEKLMSADAKEIVEKLVEKAKNGELWALKFIGERFVPLVSRQTFMEPVDYTAPTTPEEARAMILVLGERVARGELSIEAHAVLLDNLKAYLGDKAAEQERRVSELEEIMRNGGNG